MLAGWLTLAKCEDLLSGFRVFNAEKLKQVKLSSNGFELETELTIEFIRRGFHVEWVPVGYRRRYGRSKLHPLKDGLFIFWTMLKASVRKL